MIKALLLLEVPGPVSVSSTPGGTIAAPLSPDTPGASGAPVIVLKPPEPVVVPPTPPPDAGDCDVAVGLGGVSFLAIKLVVHCAEYMLYTSGVKGNGTDTPESSHDTPKRKQKTNACVQG
jgi:hypothetical protein